MNNEGEFAIKIGKAAISEQLKKIKIDLGGVSVPLITTDTCQIIIDFNNGEIARIRSNIKIK